MVSVLVDDEAGESVGFGEEEAESVGVLLEGLAEGLGLADAGFEKGLVDWFSEEGKDFDGEAGLVVVGADGEEIAFVVEEGCELSVDDVDGLGDFFFLNPRIVVSDFLFSSFFDADCTLGFHGVERYPFEG